MDSRHDMLRAARAILLTDDNRRREEQFGVRLSPGKITVGQKQKIQRTPMLFERRSIMAKVSKEIVVPKGAVERMPRPALLGDIDRVFEDLFNRRWLHPFQWERAFAEMPAMPSVDIIDRDGEVVVKAEVPGYRKEDIEISVSDSSLTIKGETKTEEKEEKGDYFRCEISHGAFTRTLALPAAVDDAKAHAVMKDGVLELTLPKLEKSKRHAITIS